MGAFGVEPTSSTVIMGFSAHRTTLHSNACTQLHINSLINAHKYTCKCTRAISFMSLRGKRNEESLPLLQCQWAETQEYLIVEYTVILPSPCVDFLLGNYHQGTEGQKEGGSERVRLLFVMMAPRCFCAFEVMGLQVTS